MLKDTATAIQTIRDLRATAEHASQGLAWDLGADATTRTLDTLATLHTALGEVERLLTRRPHSADLVALLDSYLLTDEATA